MADYAQSIDFSAKDSLATGDPNKVIYGADLDTELSLISTAVSSKLDDPTGTLSSLATNDKIYVNDVSASNNKTITVQEFFDQASYLPTSAQATTSGSSVTITGIPQKAKRITVTIFGLSFSTAGDSLSMEIGTPSFEGSGYGGCYWDVATGLSNYGGGYFELINVNATAGQAFVGTVILTKHLASSYTWVMTSSISSLSATTHLSISNGRKTLLGELTALKLFAGVGFDAGAYNILVDL